MLYSVRSHSQNVLIFSGPGSQVEAMCILLRDMSFSLAVDALWVTVTYQEGLLAGNTPLKLRRSEHKDEGESFPIRKDGKQENKMLSYELTGRVRGRKLFFLNKGRG